MWWTCKELWELVGIYRINSLLPHTSMLRSIRNMEVIPENLEQCLDDSCQLSMSPVFFVIEIRQRPFNNPPGNKNKGPSEQSDTMPLFASSRKSIADSVVLLFAITCYKESYKMTLYSPPLWRWYLLKIREIFQTYKSLQQLQSKPHHPNSSKKPWR